MTTEYTAFAQVRISTRFCEDVLCTAFEGGIDYWIEGLSATREKRDDDIVGFAYVGGIITPAEDGAEPLEITRDSLAAGIAKILEKGCTDEEARIFGPRNYSTLLRGIVEDDSGYIDADLADSIVQVALFGEVVYG